MGFAALIRVVAHHFPPSVSHTLFQAGNGGIKDVVGDAGSASRGKIRARETSIVVDLGFGLAAVLTGLVVPFSFERTTGKKGGASQSCYDCLHSLLLT
jgi:hypothetical protein